MRQSDETLARAMASSVPMRHWRTYGTEPLPAPLETLGEPLRAFPSSSRCIEWGDQEERQHNETKTVAGSGWTGRERRRAGRVNFANPHLIALLRGKTPTGMPLTHQMGYRTR